jgi:hypothetical protein
LNFGIADLEEPVFSGQFSIGEEDLILTLAGKPAVQNRNAPAGAGAQ